MRTLKLITIVAATLLIGAGCSLFGGNEGANGDAGVVKSGDYGTTWQTASFIGVIDKREVSLKNDEIIRLAIHPTDPRTLYAVTGKGELYRTVNAGGQWTRVNQNLSAITQLVIDQVTPEILYASQGGNIIKSLDSGLNWETVYIETVPTQLVSGLLIDPTLSATVYASTNTGALNVSTDNGKTWARRSSIDIPITKIAFAPDDSQTIFAVTATRGVWRSTDSGTNWEEITTPLKKIDGKAYTVNDIALKNDAATIFLGTAFGLVMTTDGGATWEAVPTVLEENTLPIQSVALDPEGKPIIYFAVQNKIHRSTDNGTHWSVAEITTSQRVGQILIDYSNSAVLYAGIISLPKK